MPSMVLHMVAIEIVINSTRVMGIHVTMSCQYCIAFKVMLLFLVLVLFRLVWIRLIWFDLIDGDHWTCGDVMHYVTALWRMCQARCDSRLLSQRMHGKLPLHVCTQQPLCFPGQQETLLPTSLLLCRRRSQCCVVIIGLFALTDTIWLNKSLSSNCLKDIFSVFPLPNSPCTESALRSFFL